MGNETEGNPIRPITMLLWRILPPKIYPMGLSTYDSMWKYKLSGSDYKSILKEVNQIDWRQKDILLKDIEGYRVGTTNLARVLILTVSEWYKRDSQSLDGDNALDLLFPNSENRPDVKKIWEASGIDQIFLHQAKKMKLRQTAICVLGGFPLHYANTSTRFKRLIKLLASDADELDSSSYDNLFDDNNTVFSGSLACGSCKEFIDQLRRFVETDDDSDLPFNPLDISGAEKEFTVFKELIRNGYAEEVRNNFFSSSIICYTCDTDTDIQAQFLIRIGFKKDKCVLFAPQLKSLGIDTRSDILFFRLVAVTGDGTKEYSRHRYDKIGNGRNDYAGRGRPEILINFDLFDTSEIKLEILDSEENLVKSITYTIPSSLELYKEPAAYCWSTATNSSAAKSVLLDFSRFQEFEDIVPIEKHSAEMHGIHPLWSWIHLNETIEVNDVDGNKIPFEYGHGQHLVVNFLRGNLKNQVSFPNGRVEEYSDEESQFIHLLFGQYDDKGKNSLNLQVFIQDEKKKKETNEYYIEFKESGKYRYSRWTSESYPEQGFISIRVVSDRRGVSGYQEEVYYIPSELPIKRDLNKNTILFNNVSSIYFLDRAKNEYIRLTEPYVDSPDMDRENDTVDFRIGDDGKGILLQVYRAFWLQVLKKDKKEIFREVTKSIRQIPILMCSRFSIWTIDNNGSISTDHITAPTIDFYRDGKGRGPSSLCAESLLRENYQLYVYHSVDIIGSKVVIKDVSPRYWREYKFYFWSEKRTEEPVKLETGYDEATRELKVLCDNLLYDNLPKKDGVIFQSLYDCNPNHYYRPIYVRVGEAISTIIAPHWNKIHIKEDIQFCYNLLETHNIYSPVFSCFIKLNTDLEKRIQLLEYVLIKEDFQLKEDSLSLLSRIAFECGFDWILTPRPDIIKIVRGSKEHMDKAVESLRRLFGRSRIVKNNHGPHMHERYYFNRIFVEGNRYFNPAVSFEQLYSDTGSKRKDMARLFVETIKGIKQKNDPVQLIISSCSDYDKYEHLFRNVFAKYFIR